MQSEAERPCGDLMTRTLAMPADANPSGDIFGGWVLSQMDIAAGICAGQRARGRVATVAIEAMSFHKPVHVGDVLCVYSNKLMLSPSHARARGVDGHWSARRYGVDR